MAFVKFYQGLHGKQMSGLAVLKIQYNDHYMVEGGVYYMLLKFLHFLKDRFWSLKKSRIDAVVDRIQKKTVEFVDEYYEEKRSYYFTLSTLSSRDVRRTVLALLLTIIFSLLLVVEGSHGKGLIGPILRSFVDQDESRELWTNYNDGRGYYEDMVAYYVLLPNFLRYVAIGADNALFFFFQAYYFVYPFYLSFISLYYQIYLGIFVGFFW